MQLWKFTNHVSQQVGLGEQRTTFSKRMPDEVVLELHLDPHSAVVALTHDPKLDDLVLLEALKSPAFYIGALGSRGNTAKRRERLALFDLTPAEIDRLHGPIGLDVGAKTPAEIGVAIIAELVAVKNGVTLMQKKPQTKIINTRIIGNACEIIYFFSY